MIRFKNVSRVYKTGTEALHNVNLKINDGEFVFILGHSGAGKSTLVSLLMCEDVPTDGDVIINGTNTKKLTARTLPKFRRSLGIVFQNFRLIPNLNVFDNIAFAMRVVGKKRKQINEKVNKVLNIVGLSHKIYDLPCNLSGGEQQRVALARAIVNNPKIIIADEPTGNVDPQMSQEIMKLLLAINKKGITVIVVTHEHEFAKTFNKRVVVLEEGEIISDTAPKSNEDDVELFDDMPGVEMDTESIGTYEDLVKDTDVFPEEKIKKKKKSSIKKTKAEKEEKFEAEDDGFEEFPPEEIENRFDDSIVIDLEIEEDSEEDENKVIEDFEKSIFGEDYSEEEAD